MKAKTKRKLRKNAPAYAGIGLGVISLGVGVAGIIKSSAEKSALANGMCHLTNAIEKVSDVVNS